MTVPNRRMTIRDGGNGVAMAGDIVRAHLGTSTAGTLKTVYAFTAPGDVADVLGYGPLADATAHDVKEGGGVVLGVRVKNTVAGVITTAVPVQTGDGTCTLTGTPNNAYRVKVKILTEGELGTASFKYTLDGGPDDTDEEMLNWSQPIAVPSGAGTYTIQNTGLILTFANGASVGVAPDSFEADDTFSYSTTAPGYVLADLQEALAELKAYSQNKWLWLHVVGETTAAIAAAIDTFMDECELAHKYRFAILEAPDVDPIGTVTKTGTTPPTLTVSGIPDESWDVVVDVVLLGALGTMTFKYSLDGGETFSAVVTSTAVTGINPLEGTGMTFTWAAGPYAADNEYTFSTWDKETNRAAWAAGLVSDFENFAHTRVMIAAGFGECSLPTGRVERVPIAWGVSPLLAKISASTDPGQTLDAGTLPGFVTISHDEALHPGLDNSGFCTTRTWDNVPGIYLNQGRMKAPPGSDYDLVQARRVMDNACEAVDKSMSEIVNSKTRVNKTTGYIDERDARNYDRKHLTALEAVTVTPGDASDCSVRTLRNENLLSTRAMTVDFDVVGMAYIKDLHGRIGYKNPALVPV